MKRNKQKIDPGRDFTALQVELKMLSVGEFALNHMQGLPHIKALPCYFALGRRDCSLTRAISVYQARNRACMGARVFMLYSHEPTVRYTFLSALGDTPKAEQIMQPYTQREVNNYQAPVKRK
jgi:hypothetical protein